MFLFYFFTLAVVVVDVGGRCSHLQGQTIGPLERVAVPDQEGSWLSLLQRCDGYNKNKPTCQKYRVKEKEDQMDQLSGVTLLPGDAGFVPEPRAVLDKLHADLTRSFTLHKPLSVLTCRGGYFSHGGREGDMMLVLAVAGGVTGGTLDCSHSVAG